MLIINGRNMEHVICLFNFYQRMHFYVIKILYKQLLT